MPLAATPALGVAGVLARAQKLTTALLAYSGQAGHTTRSTDRKLESWSSYAPSRAAWAERGVPLFASRNEDQWAIIIGTNPKGVMSPSSDTEPRTELLDAIDVLDWFKDPGLFGPIPSDQLFYFWDKGATSDRVIEALETVRRRIRPGDSLLFYFSGQATDFTETGEILLHDAFGEGEWGRIETSEKGLMKAPWLVAWINALPASTVVCILDSGGLGFERATRELAKGRYVVSSVNSRVTNRSGFLTFLVRETVREKGRGTTIDLLHGLLQESDRILSERAGVRLYAYVRGSPPD
jgi:hypothetical protein